MLRGGKHGHINTNLRENGDCGEGLDTRRCQNKVELSKVFLSSGQDQGFQILLTQVKAVHVGTDNAELFSLFDTHLPVHSGNYLLIRGFHPLGTKGRYVCDFLRWMIQQMGRNRGSGLAENVREYVVQLDIGNGKAVLRTIFFAVVKLVSFQR